MKPFQIDSLEEERVVANSPITRDEESLPISALKSPISGQKTFGNLKSPITSTTNLQPPQTIVVSESRLDNLSDASMEEIDGA